MSLQTQGQEDDLLVWKGRPRCSGSRTVRNMSRRRRRWPLHAVSSDPEEVQSQPRKSETVMKEGENILSRHERCIRTVGPKEQYGTQYSLIHLFVKYTRVHDDLLCN